MVHAIDHEDNEDRVVDMGGGTYFRKKSGCSGDHHGLDPHGDPSIGGLIFLISQ